MNGREMFLEAVASLPVGQTVTLAQKFEYVKYIPTGKPATAGMLKLLANRLTRRGYTVKHWKTV